MELFAVPLTKVTGSRSTADRFAFGKTDGRKGGAGQQKGKIQHRTDFGDGSNRFRQDDAHQWHDQLHFQRAMGGYLPLPANSRTDGRPLPS